MGRLSKAVKARVESLLLEGLEPAVVMERIRTKYLTDFMIAHNLCDRQAALTQFLESCPPRDYHISEADIANTKVELDKRLWRFSSNQQESLLLKAQMDKDSVLYCTQQKPIKGTPDYEWFMSLPGMAATSQPGNHADPVEPVFSFYNDEPEQFAAPQKEQPAGSQREVAELVRPSKDAPRTEAETAELAEQYSINDLGRECQPDQFVSHRGEKPFVCSIYNWEAFELATMTEQNVADAIKYGDGKPLQCDATFGTNGLKFPLFTLVAVDDHGNGIPIGHMVCSSETVECITHFLEAVKKRVSPL